MTTRPILNCAPSHWRSAHDEPGSGSSCRFDVAGNFHCIPRVPVDEHLVVNRERGVMPKEQRPGSRRDDSSGGIPYLHDTISRDACLP